MMNDVEFTKNLERARKARAEAEKNQSANPEDVYLLFDENRALRTSGTYEYCCKERERRGVGTTWRITHESEYYPHKEE